MIYLFRATTFRTISKRANSTVSNMSGLINYRNFSLTDTPSLKSRTAVVTGGNAGIGIYRAVGIDKNRNRGSSGEKVGDGPPFAQGSFAFRRLPNADQRRDHGDGEPDASDDGEQCVARRHLLPVPRTIICALLMQRARDQ